MNRRSTLFSLALGLFFTLFPDRVHAVPAKASDVPKIGIVFAKGAWDPNLWIAVKSPLWDYLGTFVQFEDHIMNRTPDIPDEVLFKSQSSQVYSCLMLKKKLKMNCTVSSCMSFDHRMAPLILITGGMGTDAKGTPEHRDHYEIVLYCNGINVWRHTYANGKTTWYKAAWLETKFSPKKKYELTVRMIKYKGTKQMIITCDGKKFGFTDNDLPDDFYAGIVGCEGRCRFYDFTVTGK